METATNLRSTSHTVSERIHRGSCFCGAAQLTVSGAPVAMGYCHCESCRSWSASPVNAFTLWKPEAVHVTRGADNIGTYNKTPRSYRKWCNTCGGHLFNQHPGWGLIDVYAAVISDFPYQASIHVNYQETKLRMKDGLPKMKDVPKEMGGRASPYRNGVVGFPASVSQASSQALQPPSRLASKRRHGG